jgi:hypothetical protein
MLYPLSYGRSDTHSNSPDAASQVRNRPAEKLRPTHPVAQVLRVQRVVT